MNALFSIFLETFNDPIGHQPVPPAAMGHYQGKLPNQLLTY
ncbi:GAD-like domain-containing protein [Pseudomonas putida]|nr:GAD-like domain-containing protein [Pseudomonas putida]